MGGARPYLLIILIGLLLYSSAAFFGFSYLDDNILILENHEFISKLSNIAEAFKQDVFHVLHEYDAAYRPLLTVSFIIDTQLDKFFGLGYHFTNIILHLIGSCLVFLLFLKLKYSRSLAFSFALIFTVHPVLTETVAWIPGRNDSLLGIFVLASFIYLLEFLERGKWAYYTGHILFFVLALFTKETAPALLVVALFYYSFVFKGVLLSRKQKKLFIGWLFSLAFWLILRGYALSYNPVKLSFVTLLRDLALGAPAFFVYIGKVIMPFDLSIIPTIEDSAVIYGIAAVLIITLGLYFSKKKRYGFILIGLVWFLSFLTPTFIRPVPGASTIFLESRIYLPILGIFIILGEIDAVKSITFKNIRALLAVMVITGSLFCISINYSSRFQNALEFWEYAVKRSPHSALAQASLGWVYDMQLRYDEAETRFKKALALNPYQRYAHNSLGLIYERKGLLEKAEAEYIMEIENTPYYNGSRINLANLYFRQGKEEKAAALWKEALRANPEDMYVRNMLKACYDRHH
ncbi:MAG: tetratricopeptide repeat protein [Candidatus Omnitrophica bacterium]|nr:tetratricopeptide repeat protein [Candidatus Omnitrophota bacterium]